MKKKEEGEEEGEKEGLRQCPKSSILLHVLLYTKILKSKFSEFQQETSIFFLTGSRKIQENSEGFHLFSQLKAPVLSSSRMELPGEPAGRVSPCWLGWVYKPNERQIM
uniref:Uncharacterized protein n=1 Tax=Zosterops lateralis melanops TaxID=1220523 RepID=A0A8D2PNY6_ZOSLA